MQKRRNDVKTFGGDEATRKTKKNLLKQQYGNFKAEWKETLEQTFNKLHAIVSQLEFMEVEIEQDDFNQKLLTSLAPEWLMHTNVWRNRSDLDTMSLDDLYDHLKVYEPEVQKKSDSQNMAFISSSKNSSGNEEDNTASSNGSQVKYEDINQIDEDDIKEIDIKWNMALLSMRVNRYWKKTGKRSLFKGLMAPMSQDRGRKDNYRQGSKLEEQAPKALMAIDGVGWDWSYMVVDEENHALVADEEAPTEFALMAKTSTDNELFDNSLCSKACKKNTNSLNSQITKLSEKLGDTKNMLYHYKLGLSKTLKKEKEGLESKITGFKSDSKDLDNLLESQRSDKNKEGLGYSVVPPPPAQVYSPPKKYMSWTGLFEFADGTITDYTRPSLSVENSLTVVKTDKKETVRKPTVKYAKLYRKTPKRSNVDHGRSWAKNNNTHKSRTPKTVFYKTGRPPMRTNRPYMNTTQPKRTSYYKPTHLYLNRPFQRTSAVRSQFRGLRVPTVNRKFPTVNRKFPTSNSRFSTADMGSEGKAIKASAYWIWKPTQNLSNKGPNSNSSNSQINIDDKGYWDSGCSWHMTGNMSYLSDYKPYDGGYVSLGQAGCKITGKGTFKTGKLEFKNVYFVKDLKYNLFSVSQICDNKNSVLFTDTECIVLGQNFKLTDDANVLLRTPRQHNKYSIDLNNVFPHKNLTCLVAKASADECMLWHSRLSHLNIKIMNRLVWHNLVRGLPSKCFKNDHTCVACLKGKQHNASCKTKLVNSVTKPLYTLHMDLFGPTSVSSINHKWYCLVVTDEFSRFTWSFFLKTKDETSGILRTFITKIENLKELRVKIIRCDNRGEFRNKKMNDFCSRKGVKREFSTARTPPAEW
nr:putative ribonuclease H-like domain-containing protein [Tanacetum cinerariifolium]